MIKDWNALFAEARQSPAWKSISPARRDKILYAREERTSGDRWVIRDLHVDLQKDVAEKLVAAHTKPRILSVFADVVHVPANLTLSLSNAALIIVARRIEAEVQATIVLDYSVGFGATLILFAQEIDGTLEAESRTTQPERLFVTVTPGLLRRVKYDHAEKNARVSERSKLEGVSFEMGSPLWLAAVSAFQMATALVSPAEPDEPPTEDLWAMRGRAAKMLEFIVNCAKDAAMAKKDSALDWDDLARQALALQLSLQDGAAASAGIESAHLYARLLNKETPVAERQRRLEAFARARTQRDQAPPYDLLEANVTPPKPEDTKYIRHGAQTIGTKTLNGWNRPVRKVTLSGVEIELDVLDRSGFLKTYGGQKDVQELEIHADTLVVKTRLHLPQTNVAIHCRELYFEGAGACIDTQPEATDYRASLDKDGADGAKAGTIRLFVHRFGTTENPGAEHFRAVGGQGQKPDEGDIALSYTLRHLPLLKKENWDALFSYTNRQNIASAPDWDAYTQYRKAASDDETLGIVYAALEIDGRLIHEEGVKAEPGTGGKGPLPGTPGTGGAGGDLYSTLPEQMSAYTNLSGGASGAHMVAPKGGVGGTPDVAYWFLFKNKTVNGSLAFVPEIEEKNAKNGPDGDIGPVAREAKGEDGQLKAFDPAVSGGWLTAINLKAALQFAKDALVSANTGVARELLMPYLEALDALPATAKDDSILALEAEGTALAEQSIQNVDHFGNPPGWVPMLSLTSAVKIYQSILKSSIQEIYTSYYIQKAWQAKADRQEAVQSLVGLLTKSTESTQKSLVTTRAAVVASMQALKQLNVEIEEKLEKPLKVIAKRLNDQADYLTDRADKAEIISAAFKIFGAVAKAIPLPEPYQMAAGALGTVFDITGEFIAEGGATDKAFDQLKNEVNSFLSDNTEGFIERSEKGLDDSLVLARSDIKQLQEASRVASAKKAALQDAYDVQEVKHDAYVASEKKRLDALREQLLYGRGSKKKETQAWMDREFTDFQKAQEKKLLANTKDYQAAAADVRTSEGVIADKEEEWTKAAEEVEAAKKANAEFVKAGIQQVKNITAGVETVAKTVNKLMVSRSQLNSKWGTALSTLKLNDKEFQQVIAQLAALNQMKTSLATELLALKTQLVQQRSQISNNLLTVNALSSQLGSSKDALDPMALAYAQSIGRDAHQSLMQFLYYVVKAYDYYMVESSGKLDDGVQKLFESLQNVIDPSDRVSGIEGLNVDQKSKLTALLSKPVAFKDNLLSESDFELLQIVYEKPLRDMGKRLASQLASGSGRLLKNFPKIVTLGKGQLDALNAKIRASETENVVPLSLVQLRQLDLSNEKQRIGNIKVVKVQGRKLGKKYPNSVTFKIRLRGKSVLRAQGRLFAFEPEGGPKDTKDNGGAQPGNGAQMSQVIFQTIGGKTADVDDWLTSPGDDGAGEVGTLKGAALWQPQAAEQADLLTQFLAADPAAGRIMLTAFRPGVFSDFDMTVEFSPPESRIAFEEIALQITTEAGDAPRGQTLVAVSTEPALPIPIMMSTMDMSGRKGGLESYIGVFKDQLTLRMRVPPSFGSFKHTGWRVDGEDRPDGGQHSLEVRKSCYVEAIFKDR